MKSLEYLIFCESGLHSFRRTEPLLYFSYSKEEEIEDKWQLNSSKGLIQSTGKRQPFVPKYKPTSVSILWIV